MSIYCKRPGCGHVDGNHSKLSPEQPCLEHGCKCEGLQVEEEPAEQASLGQMTDAEIRAMGAMLAEQVYAHCLGRRLEAEQAWLVLKVAAEIGDRAMLWTEREANDLPAYAAAHDRLKRLLAQVAAEADEVEQVFAAGGQTVPGGPHV